MRVAFLVMSLASATGCGNSIPELVGTYTASASGADVGTGTIQANGNLDVDLAALGTITGVCVPTARIPAPPSLHTLPNHPTLSLTR